MERETFYVTVDQGAVELADIQTPDNKIQFEVELGPDEKKEMKDLIQAIAAQDAEGDHVVSYPFNEPAADADKQLVEERIRKLYQRIYDYGTPKTKEQVAEIAEDIKL
ncbi:hypothetical protein B0H94_110125 [Salsuginibacillus halophilus]|uniref:Uncharacterized protein n=1 Tax=Salsuginibacillus halophilus TaxID=517424 RepID=A0A2P8HBP9_9BACI|nr:hypothetical protein [Salsuginibacillus halophilus]PSL43649.1 hypothetical protein B0H94_110125 [Salsuginibacillus halophilus]